MTQTVPPQDSPQNSHKNNPWRRRLWILAALGSGFALSPLVPALVGLALDDMDLMTFHWLLYFTVPVGAMVAMLAAGLALALAWRDYAKRKTEE